MHFVLEMSVKSWPHLTTQTVSLVDMHGMLSKCCKHIKSWGKLLWIGVECPPPPPYLATIPTCGSRQVSSGTDVAFPPTRHE